MSKNPILKSNDDGDEEEEDDVDDDDDDDGGDDDMTRHYEGLLREETHQAYGESSF